jgi:hypothetical protein
MSSLSGWTEIQRDLGAQLWAVFRQHMHTMGTIGVHMSSSDPDGEYGDPTMMTVVGPKNGAAVLRLETKWTKPDRSDQITRYWLRATRQKE